MISAAMESDLAVVKILSTCENEIEPGCVFLSLVIVSSQHGLPS